MKLRINCNDILKIYCYKMCSLYTVFGSRTRKRSRVKSAPNVNSAHRCGLTSIICFLMNWSNSKQALTQYLYKSRVLSIQNIWEIPIPMHDGNPVERQWLLNDYASIDEAWAIQVNVKRTLTPRKVALHDHYTQARIGSLPAPCRENAWHIHISFEFEGNILTQLWRVTGVMFKHLQATHWRLTTKEAFQGANMAYRSPDDRPTKRTRGTNLEQTCGSLTAKTA